MPDKKKVDVHVQMRAKDLRSLVRLLGAVTRLHAGEENRQVVMDDLMNAITPEDSEKLWDLFIKVQVDQLHLDKVEVDEPVTVVVPVRKITDLKQP